jgi:hypothetical protein
MESPCPTSKNLTVRISEIAELEFPSTETSEVIFPELIASAQDENETVISISARIIQNSFLFI